MAYEYEEENKASALINPPKAYRELQEVYRKAKAFNEVRSFITKRLKEEETTDEYDYGERLMCEEIKRLWEDE
ncbi:hypothetical protein [Staphylococcus gallinarum]|uniref:hypothetical protein n=1 Tax=Staphylococcus gallinarum TaxID=1293 RepID=UPI000E6A87E4|nr:hypothetical protein [Staphylococcus gallinarum]RIL22694.1 hypothetical protein BUY99_06430 [Staphylococcus gallinarum]RIO86376.1 hypothetical protein BUZ10_02585 [Staphylococcus gallinarum]